MESLGISFVTTLPAPMTALSPIVTPGKIVQFPPIQTFLPIVTGLPNSTSNNHSFESNEWQAVYICVFGPIIVCSPILTGHTSKITQA